MKKAFLACIFLYSAWIVADALFFDEGEAKDQEVELATKPSLNKTVKILDEDNSPIPDKKPVEEDLETTEHNSKVDLWKQRFQGTADESDLLDNLELSEDLEEPEPNKPDPLAGVDALVKSQESPNVEELDLPPELVKEVESQEEENKKSVSELTIEYKESSYRFNPSDSNRLDLILAYESAVRAKCLQDALTKLDYSGPPDDPECTAPLLKLIAFYPDSSIGVCARDGFRSPSCRDRAAEYQLSPFSVSTRGEIKGLPQDMSLDIESYLRVRNDPRQSKAYKSFAKKKSAYKKAKDELAKAEAEIEYLRAFDKRIRQLCNPELEKLSIERPSSVKFRQNKLKTNSFDPNQEIEKLLSQRQKNNPLNSKTKTMRDGDSLPFANPSNKDSSSTQSNSQDKSNALETLSINNEIDLAKVEASYKRLWRYRYIPSDCYKEARGATSALPNFARAICVTEGVFTPSCLAARQKERGYMKRLRQNLEMLRRRKGSKEPLENGEEIPSPTPKPRALSTF